MNELVNPTLIKISLIEPFYHPTRLSAMLHDFTGQLAAGISFYLGDIDLVMARKKKAQNIDSPSKQRFTLRRHELQAAADTLELQEYYAYLKITAEAMLAERPEMSYLFPLDEEKFLSALDDGVIVASFAYSIHGVNTEALRELEVPPKNRFKKVENWQCVLDSLSSLGKLGERSAAEYVEACDSGVVKPLLLFMEVLVQLKAAQSIRRGVTKSEPDMAAEDEDVEESEVIEWVKSFVDQATCAQIDEARAGGKWTQVLTSTKIYAAIVKSLAGPMAPTSVIQALERLLTDQVLDPMQRVELLLESLRELGIEARVPKTQFLFGKNATHYYLLANIAHWSEDMKAYDILFLKVLIVF